MPEAVEASTVDIRQHTSAYVSIRQHTSAYVSIRSSVPEAIEACGRLRLRKLSSLIVSRLTMLSICLCRRGKTD
jgi:hypothetical protein